MIPILKVANVVCFGDPFVIAGESVYPVVEQQYRFVAELGDCALDLQTSQLYPIIEREAGYEVMVGQYYISGINPVLVEIDDTINMEILEEAKSRFSSMLPKIMEYQTLLEQKKIISMQSYQLKKQRF